MREPSLAFLVALLAVASAADPRGPQSEPPKVATEPTPGPKSDLTCGTPEECYGRGNDYYYGRGGVDRDYAQAEAHYRRASDGGIAKAWAKLGLMYDKGQGEIGRASCRERV